jgi:hypothetical protein
MSEVVEIIPQSDGGRIIIFDDGSRITELGTIHIQGDPGPQVTDRGLGDRLLLGRDPGILGQRTIDANNPEDLAWLRFEIEHGNITRESQPIVLGTPDEFVIIAEYDGWSYMIGRRTGTTVASLITGRIGVTPTFAREQYLWGVRGSSAARTAWRRDYLRAGGLPFASQETTDVLADTGIAPETALLSRSIDIPRALLMLSQHALQSQESVRRYTDQFVAQYNDERYGSIVGIIAGILEFGFRIVTDIIGLPAALEQLFREVGTVFQEIEQSIPDILEGLNNAPAETILAIISATQEAVVTLTGLGDIGTEFSTSVELADDLRSAESSLHIIRGTGRVIELILIVKSLISAVRRLPAIAARMRANIARLSQAITRLRAMRQALREGRRLAAATDDVRSPRTESPRVDTPDTSETRSRPRSEEPRVDESDVRGDRSSDERLHSDDATDRDLNIDEALDENAPYGSRESVPPERSGRVPLRRSDGTSTRLDTERHALHRLQTQILTREQIRAAARFVGQRLNSQLQQVWRGVWSQTDRDDLNEIRRLLRRAEAETSPAVQRALRQGAYEIARDYLYPRVAGKFWNSVRTTPRLAHIFESAGLQLRPNRVPAWILPDGTEVRLSLEHLTRVSDNPLLAIDPRNLSIVPLAENSDLLEAIRAISRFSEFAMGQ